MALTTSLAVLVPSVAVADSYVRPDATQDVVKYDNPSDKTATKVPDRAEGDIFSSGVSHRKRRVWMAMRADELTQTGDGATFLFRIGTKRMIRRLYIDTSPGHWAGEAFFLRDVRTGPVARCRGIRRSIDYAADLVRASVPRRCLGRPTWVRVGMVEATLENPAFFVDDAGTNGYWTGVPKWGPRVYR